MSAVGRHVLHCSSGWWGSLVDRLCTVVLRFFSSSATLLMGAQVLQSARLS